MFRARAGSTRLFSKTDPTRFGTLVLVLTLSACHAPAPAVAPVSPPLTPLGQLRRDIDAILAAAPLARSYWGIAVKSARNEETLYSLNSGKLLMPGSLMKIVTLAAAADRLGWDYTFETNLMIAGSVDAGSLDGDLIVAGSGDPSIVEDGVATELFGAWAEVLKSTGIRSIAGRIVGDDNAFDDDPWGPGWAWDDLAGRDAAPISALQFNENVVQAAIAPGAAAGLPAVISFTPDKNTLEVENHLVTEPPGTILSVTARRAGPGTVALSGTIPSGVEPFVRILAVDNPTLYFVTALRAALVAHGIEVRGAAIDIDDIADPPPADRRTTIATHRSLPLSELSLRLMKNSQNLYAETLLKTLGATGESPTLESGRMVVADVLTAWGVPPAGLVQVDGSGLSRYNYVTADTVTAVLSHIHRDDRLRVPFEASLPIAGRDGTLAARMKGTAAEGNVRAKSGTLANVRSLAGFVTSADGEPLIFVIMANNFGTMPEVAISAIDAIAARLAEFRRS
jgi:D-alanyl-D-alanine carboxypeptidase/D-alanyl-D-alanine-endopeptidase (penicillin-binding protein 4)